MEWPSFCPVDLAISSLSGGLRGPGCDCSLCSYVSVSRENVQFCLAGRARRVNAVRCSGVMRFQTFAEALDALRAIARRCLAVRDLARAGPPFLPSSDIRFLSVSPSTLL